MKKAFKIIHVVAWFTLFLVIGNLVFAASSSTKQTEHFKIIRIKGEIEELSLAGIAKKLESTYSDVSNYLGITSYKTGKIEVVISNRDMDWKAGDASWSKIHLRIDCIDTSTVRHELTHILIRKVLPIAPRWFHEGVAQYVQYGHIMPNYESLAPFPESFSFAKLNQNFSKSNTRRDAYNYSYAIMSYLVEEYGEEIFKGMFKKKGNFKRRFEEVYGMKLKTLEKKVKKIFSK